MKKSGFTLIELIIVIVVAGILAAVMIPRLERDNLREAANQVVRHIQYTQHLAMMNDVYDAGDINWRGNRWMIDLCDEKYAVQRVNGTATATDPLTQLDMNGTVNTAYDLVNNGVTIGVTGVNGCRITFDNLGRPHDSLGEFASNATITLTDSSSRDADITVTLETGYVSSVLN